MLGPTLRDALLFCLAPPTPFPKPTGFQPLSLFTASASLPVLLFATPASLALLLLQELPPLLLLLQPLGFSFSLQLLLFLGPFEPLSRPLGLLGGPLRCSSRSPLASGSLPLFHPRLLVRIFQEYWEKRPVLPLPRLVGRLDPRFKCTPPTETLAGGRGNRKVHTSYSF